MHHTVLPFRGYLYNQSLIASLTDVISPPYDVITEPMQEELYAQSPYNFCRVDFTREAPPERYAIAKTTLDGWLADGILTRDARPAVYRHRFDFTMPDGKRVARGGFFALRCLDDDSSAGVKPHEKTLEAPKRDRLLLMRATSMQLSPVFCLYEDPHRALHDAISRVEKTTPFADFVIKDAERHRLWKIADENQVNAITTVLSDSPLVIADGHHRFETARDFLADSVQRQSDLPPNAACRHVLIYFTDVSAPGLAILPIHRGVHGLNLPDRTELLTRLKSWFEVSELSLSPLTQAITALTSHGEKRHAFLLAFPADDKALLLTLDGDRWRDSVKAHGLPPELAVLDVTVLHKLLFGEILGLSEESQARQENLSYHKSADSALTELAAGRLDMAVFMNPTPIEQVRSAAFAGYKMPQKSTFFYPKVPSGLVLHAVGAEDTDGF